MVSLNPLQIQQAREYALRIVIQGKPVDPRIKSFKPFFERLQSQDAQFKRDVQSGVAERIKARRLGFRNIEEFRTIQKRSQKEAQKVISKKPLQERLRLQRELTSRKAKELIEFKKIKKLSPKEKQKFFRQQVELKRATEFKRLQKRGVILSSSAKRFLQKVQTKRAKEFSFEQKRIEAERKFVERPPSVVEAREQLRGIEGRLQKIDTERKILRTKLTRGTITRKERAKLSSLAALSSFVGAAVGFKQLPSNLINIAKDPRSLTKVPAEIKKGGKEFGQLLKISPTEALAKIGAEIVILKGTSSGLKVTGKLTGKAATRLSPKFRGIKKNKITIPSGQVGKKTIDINIGGTVKKLQEPLRKQLELEGKKVTAVSAQANRLVNVIKTGRVVRKPIPGEDKLSRSTKVLLKRFDEGRISKQGLIDLDNRIRVETKGAGNLLERSFFADPRGRLRPSRLGVKQKEATLLDILAGDVTFKTPKPQVLLFEQAKVQEFPKTQIFDSIKKELKKKSPKLTKKQSDALLKFQLKKGGKFKPIGALTREPEITLAPGEIIKKQKTIAVTLINGKRVPIVLAKVIKASPSTKKLLTKAEKGKITAKELKILRKKLKKETGFKSSLSRDKIGRPIVKARPIPRIPKRVRKRISKRVKKRPRPRPRPKPRPTPKARPRPTPRARPKPRVPKRPKRVTRIGRPPGKPTPRPPKKLIFPKVKKKKEKKKVKRKQAYKVLARPLKRKGQKKRPKLIKVNRVPLTKRKAKNLRNYITDTSLSRTAKIKKTKGKPRRPRIKVPSNYAKRTSRKFRSHRIIKGKRKKLSKGTVIEKRTRLLDTRQERKGITLRRRIKQITPRKPKVKVRVKRIIKKPVNRITKKRSVSPAQLEALEKGRAKRKENLKKRR